MPAASHSKYMDVHMDMHMDVCMHMHANLYARYLADDVTFHRSSGYASAPPSDPPSVGKSAVIDHLKSAEIPRMRRLLHSTQPSALLVDGRTATQFCLRSKADGSLERFTDVLGRSETGVKSGR